MSRVIVGTLALAMLGGACTTTSSASGTPEEPLRKETVGDEVRLTLTERAVERLGVASVSVRRDGGRLVVDAGAVLVDAEGAYWVYTRPAPRVFVRVAVDLALFDGDVAVLRRGPPAGTEVVTFGAAELFGAEFGIGK